MVPVLTSYLAAYVSDMIGVGLMVLFMCMYVNYILLSVSVGLRFDSTEGW